MSASFEPAKERREVIHKIFSLMDADPDMGPKLRDADTPQRFEFTDLDLVVNIRAGAPGGSNLVWEWSDDIDWGPPNKSFPGKENGPIAIARRRIKAGGDVKAALAIMPITKPLFARYREM